MKRSLGGFRGGARAEFGFVIIGGRIDQDCVYGWYPIGDDRTLLAPSLRANVEELLSGQLSV